MAETDDLLDYEEADEQEDVIPDGAGDGNAKKELKGTYVSIHSSGFRDFLLKPELLRAIVDCGFEHPSEGSLNSRRDLFYFHISLIMLKLGGVCCVSTNNGFRRRKIVSRVTKILHRWMNDEWTDTSLRYRHWRMCFERLLQAFARWQPGILFDIAAQPILEWWVILLLKMSYITVSENEILKDWWLRICLDEI